MKRLLTVGMPTAGIFMSAYNGVFILGATIGQNDRHIVGDRVLSYCRS